MKIRVTGKGKDLLRVKAGEVPTGRFARVVSDEGSLRDYVAHLRVSEGLIRFMGGYTPVFYSLSAYNDEVFEVLPKTFAITLGGK